MKKNLFDIIPEERFEFLKNGSSESFYLSYKIKKKSGKFRDIRAPQEPLKSLQRLFRDLVLSSMPIHHKAVGFREGVSVRDGAEIHLGAKVILTMDIHDFFPSISNSSIEYFIYYLTRYLEAQDVEITPEQSVLVHKLITFKNALPQGSPCSPDIANIYCFPMDKKLEELAITYNLVYTRYADDISFSHKDSKFTFSQELISYIKSILWAHKFKTNYAKTRILRQHRRMEVTGIVINQKISLENRKIKKLRAEIHNLWKSKQTLNPKQKQVLQGRINWVKQVAPHRMSLLDPVKVQKVLYPKRTAGKTKSST